MTDHFKHSLIHLGALAAVLGLLWFKFSHVITDPPRILGPNDREAVSVNTQSHIVTVQTPTGTKSFYSRDPIIHIEKNGTIKIDRKLYGFEFNPFLGIGYGDTLRGHVGVGCFYIWRFDVNTHLAFGSSSAHPFIVPMTSLSYNFWRNTSLFVATNPVSILFQQPPEYSVGLLVRF